MESLPNLPRVRRSAWFNRAWLAALYLAGLLLWGQFLNWGRIPLTFHDWADITSPRLTFLKDAFTKGELPLHISNRSTLDNVTDRFLSVPDQILSPQIVLLRFLPVGSFVLVNTWLLYSAGYVGILWFRHRFGLSFVPFLTLFALFNFNGYILAHVAVGHATWGGYFLFPWFAALVFQLVDGKNGWAWITQMSVLLLVTFLQGSFHQFVWELLFLALLAVVRRDYFRAAIGATLFAVLLSLVRIMPAALIVGSFNRQFYGGYESASQLWQSLVTIYTPGVRSAGDLMPTSLGLWEFSLFVGLAGAAFLLYFGVWRWLRPHPSDAGYHDLALPVTMLAVFSIGWMFALVRLIPIPLLDGERVSSRMISLPFVFLVILAAVELQRWLSLPGREVATTRILTAGALVIGLHDLWQNFDAWQIVRTAAGFAPKEFDASAWFVANHPDLKYTIVLAAGALLSWISLGLLSFLTWRSRRDHAPSARLPQPN